MSEQQANEEALEVQEKHPLEASEEPTVEGNFYRPPTDIYETPEALMVVMEIPGVDRDQVDVQLDQYTLTVTARIGLERYRELTPLYTEYDVGHFTRSFRLSNEVDRERIAAQVTDGVLTLTLPKIEEATPRRIEVSS